MESVWVAVAVGTDDMEWRQEEVTVYLGDTGLTEDEIKASALEIAEREFDGPNVDFICVIGIEPGSYN